MALEPIPGLSGPSFEMLPPTSTSNSTTQPSTSSSSSSSSPLSTTHRFRPYYAPYEVLELVRLQSFTKLNPQLNNKGQFDDIKTRKPMTQQRIDQIRQTAITFIERVGMRLGFPRRSIALAQQLFHRFHLHFALKDWGYQDVSIAALLVASKLQDTLKKLRDIQIAAWQVNNMLDGGSGIGEGDSSKQEQHRPFLITIERHILQTLCFNFTLNRSIPDVDSIEQLINSPILTQGDIFTHVIRLSLSLGSSKTYTALAYTLAIDLQRTLAPLSYPPHVCAASCIWFASFLTIHHRNSKSWRDEEAVEGDDKDPNFNEDPMWCEAQLADLRDIALSLTSIFVALSPSTTSLPIPLQNPSPSFSPSPFSPAEPLSHSTTSRAVSTAASEKDKALVVLGIPHTIAGSIAYQRRIASSSAPSSLPPLPTSTDSQDLVETKVASEKTATNPTTPSTSSQAISSALSSDSKEIKNASITEHTTLPSLPVLPVLPSFPTAEEKEHSITSSVTFAGVPKRVEEWQKVQIALRRYPIPSTTSYTPSLSDSIEASSRWIGSEAGIDDIKKVQKEREQQDRMKAEREIARYESRLKGLMDRGIPSEEEFKEKEKIIKAQTSILYQF